MIEETLPELISMAEAKAAGLSMYYTGKPCKRGHVATRRLPSGNCTECVRLFDKTEDRSKKHMGYDHKYRRTTPAGKAVALYASTKARAERHDVAFDLTKVWIKAEIDKGVCAITGAPFTFVDVGKYQKNPWTPTVDRIDAAKGFVQSNCRLVVAAHVYARGDNEEAVVHQIN